MRFTVAIVFLCTLSVRAQDVLSIGSASAASGGTASIPISIRDTSGTPLGSDLQGFAFKVLFPAESISSIGFARAGVTSSLTPLFETTLQGEGWIAYVASFSDVIGFTPDGAGDPIGTLTLTLEASVAVGTTVELRFDPPSAILSNQSASVRETVANGDLALVNGSVSVVLGVPSSVVATAANVSQVNVSWSGVVNADYYQVWRSVDGGAYAIVGSPVATAFTDATVVAGKTYLYRVRAIDASLMSSFSNVDAATTIFFTDDPLVAQSTVVKALHFTQLRTAVNAFRASAGLAALPADGTVVAGALVRSEHLTDLRTALDEARSAAGVAALSYTDTTLTTVKAVHAQELRNGVR